MNVLAAESGFTRSDHPITVGTDGTLEKGPAFSEILNLKSPASYSPDEWPVFRHDNARTGTTKSNVPAVLATRWETKLGTRASAPVIAAGMVFAAEVDGHAVCAMNVTDGKIVWRFFADGRVVCMGPQPGA